MGAGSEATVVSSELVDLKLQNEHLARYGNSLPPVHLLWGKKERRRKRELYGGVQSHVLRSRTQTLGLFTPLWCSL